MPTTLPLCPSHLNTEFVISLPFLHHVTSGSMYTGIYSFNVIISLLTTKDQWLFTFHNKHLFSCPVHIKASSFWSLFSSSEEQD